MIVSFCKSVHYPLKAQKCNSNFYFWRGKSCARRPATSPGGLGSTLTIVKGSPPFGGASRPPHALPLSASLLPIRRPWPSPSGVLGGLLASSPGMGGGVPLCPASPLPVDPLPIKERLPRAPRGLDQEGRRQLPRQSMRIPAPRPVAAMACPAVDPPACRPTLPAASPSIGSRRGLASIASPGRSAAGIRGGSPGEGKGGGLACLPALGHRRRGRSLPGWIPGSIQGLGQRPPLLPPAMPWQRPPCWILPRLLGWPARVPGIIPLRRPSATPGSAVFCRGSADKEKGSRVGSPGASGSLAAGLGNPGSSALALGRGAFFLAGSSPGTGGPFLAGSSDREKFLGSREGVPPFWRSLPDQLPGGASAWAG